MATLVYDNTFPGFLTAVFEVYEYRLADVHIAPQAHAQTGLFGDNRLITTDDAKAERVWKGIAKQLPVAALHSLYKTFLSEQAGMEDKLLKYVHYALASGDVSKDYTHPAVLYVAETAKKVHREKHRMEAFVRFRRTTDDIYFATVEPDFNVLPLIAEHFEKRYADQHWLIYDLRRNYGIYYNLHGVTVVQMDLSQVLGSTQQTGSILADDDKEFSRLWQNYFRSVNIASRRNPKLHRQHMPLRYWKYLTEKL